MEVSNSLKPVLNQGQDSIQMWSLDTPSGHHEKGLPSKQQLPSETESMSKFHTALHMLEMLLSHQ